jgi:hypothetical protein
MVRCLTYVRSALKSGRTANAVVMTNSSARQHSVQPSSSGRKAPKFLKSPQGKLGEFRPRKGTLYDDNDTASELLWTDGAGEGVYCALQNIADGDVI